MATNKMRKTFFVFISSAMMLSCSNSAKKSENYETYVDTMEQVTDVSDTVGLADSIAHIDESVMQTTDSVALPPDTISASKTAETKQPEPVYKKVFAHSSDGYVNVRSKPTTKSAILGKLRQGDSGAKYIKTVNDWYKIEYGDSVGYVKSTYAIVDDSDRQVSKDTKNTGMVYYVVLGSFDDYNRAKEQVDRLPAKLLSPLYKVTENGKVKYRICESCFVSKDKAKAQVRILGNEYGGARDLWVWESKGLADCVYRPYGVKGKERIGALTPIDE